MGPTESAILGVVQGITEFLPISSSAHIRVVPALLGWQDPGVAYTAVIQLGSVLAVIGYFWKDLITIGMGALKGLKEKDFANQDVRLVGAILLGTIPVCVFGLLMKPLLESDTSPLRSLMVIGGSSIFMGLLLLFAEKKGQHKRTMDRIGARDGLLVGLGQAMALIPGCSRSGSTLTVAMLLDLKRDDAARFSFLLGIPAITLSGLFELKHMLEAGITQAAVLDLVIGFVISLVVSYVAIAWLLKYLRNHSTWVFVGYRLLFGIAIIALSAKSIIH